jgi:hypothetical protein
MHRTIAAVLTIGRISFDAHQERARWAELAACPIFNAALDEEREEFLASVDRPGPVSCSVSSLRAVA